MVLSFGNAREKRKLAIRGKDMEEIHLTFDVSNEGSKWICYGEDEEDEMLLTEQRQSIIDYLDMNGEMTYGEIQQAAKEKKINVAPSYVKFILANMKEDRELFQRQKRGKYFTKHMINAGVGLALKRMVK